MSDDMFQVPLEPNREVVVITVPPNEYEIQLRVEDGRRVAIKYGHTTRTFDAETRQWLGTSTDRPSEPPSQMPKLMIARIGPDDLADLHAQVRQIVSGDA